jgi:hypothetical protein
MDRARDDLRAHEEAGRKIAWVDRSAAMLAAMEGRDAAALAHLEDAFENGNRDLGLFDEPPLRRLADEPVFQSLRQRTLDDLARQRAEVLRLLCGEGPASDHWQPLPETCQGVEAAP